MKATKWTALSALFVVLLATSIYGAYSYNQMPLTRSKNNVNLQYIQMADYNYTAYVNPSLLYDNRTEIYEGEPLYINLVEQLDIDFRYNLTQYPSPLEMSEVELSYVNSYSLSGGDWNKTYPLSSWDMNVTSFTESYTLNLTEIKLIVETLEEETGSSVYSYTYEINPRISLRASAGNKTVEHEFNPILKINFGGGKIEFEGLSNSKTGHISHLEKEAATTSFLGYTVEVNNMRTTSILASISFVALLYVPSKRILKERSSRSFLESLSGDIKEKIIESTKPLEFTEGEKIVVASLDDLAKVSEETFKPIIRHGESFYVIDGEVRYEFTMEIEPDAEEN